MTRLHSRTLIALFLVGAACAQSAFAQTASATKATQAEDEAAIKTARNTQTKAMADEDIERVVSYWTPDITIRRALGQTLTGAAEARKVIEPAANTPPSPTRMIYQRVPVSVSASTNWPLAYEEGKWSGHVGNANAPELIGGRYSAQWVKRDGKWLIRSEVFVAISCAEALCKAAAAP